MSAAMWSTLDRHARRALLIIAAAAAYRTIFIFLFPLGPDECFYWDWSRRLDLSYVEHPPLVAYAIALMTALFGDTPWAARLLALPLAAISSWFLFQCGRTLYDSRVGFWAAALHALCPMFSAAGGSMLLPESLLVFWITLALWLSSRLVISGRLTSFYALGLVMGGALLSKYPGLLIPLALGLFALCSPRHRAWFRRKEPYIMVALGLAIFSPVLIWNIQHDWAGITFVGARTTPLDTAPPLTRVWQSLAAQAAYHSPLLFVLAWYGVLVAGWRALRQRDERALLLCCFSAPVIIVFLVAAAFRHTLPHWPASGYLAAYVAAPAALLTPPGAATRTRRNLLIGAGALAGLASVLMPVLLVYPLTTVVYNRIAPRAGLPANVVEPMAEASGWDAEVPACIAELRARIMADTGAEPVVLTHFHMLAGLLAYGLRDVGPVLSVHANAHQYEIWHDDTELLGRAVIYVSAENSALYRGAPEDFYIFDECVPQPDIFISRRGITFNRVHLWVCQGYRGPAPRPATP